MCLTHGLQWVPKFDTVACLSSEKQHTFSYHLEKRNGLMPLTVLGQNMF